MSFSIDNILNGNLTKIIEYLNNGPIVENFMIGGINAGNKNTTLTETQVNNLAETTKDIDESMMIENSAKLLKSVINNVVSKNQSSLLQALAASNNISLEGGKIGKDLNIKNINQQNKIDLSGNATFAQKVQNDITTQITDEVNKTFKKAAMSSATTGTSTSVGETLGKAMDAVASVGTSFMDNAGKVLDGSGSITAGNKTTTESKTSTTKTIKDTFKLNDSFNLTSNEDFNNAVSNQLSTENLASCAQNAQANNSVDLSNVTVGGNANITDIDQSNFVTAALDCAFNQDITNKLAAIFVTNYSNLVDNMLQNTTTNNSGDILAAGTAGAAMICAAGAAISDASIGLGSGISTGVQGIGSGVSTGAQGIGSGVGNALSGLMMNPLSIVSCCFVLIAIIAGIAYFMMQKKNSDQGSTPEGSTPEGSTQATN